MSHFLKESSAPTDVAKLGEPWLGVLTGMVKFSHCHASWKKVRTSLPLVKLLGKEYVSMHDVQVGEL